MKKCFIICLYLINVFLVSCEEPVHSVEWYQQHEAERKIMLEKCSNNSNLMMKDQNCRNASSADFRSDHFKKSSGKSWSIEDGTPERK